MNFSKFLIVLKLFKLEVPVLKTSKETGLAYRTTHRLYELIRNGKVKVEVVKDAKAETLLKETIRKVKRGSSIYTDRYKSYDGPVMYGFRHERG